MSYECEAQTLAAQPVLSIRTRGAVENLPALLGESYMKIIQYLGPTGEQPAGPPFVAYYNFDMQDLDIEIGFPVAGPLPGQGDIQHREIPAGRYAMVLYVGPYDQCEPAYNALNEWITQNDHEVTGVAYEFYLNDPGTTAPQDLQTRILFPLKN